MKRSARLLAMLLALLVAVSANVMVAFAEDTVAEDQAEAAATQTEEEPAAQAEEAPAEDEAPAEAEAAAEAPAVQPAAPAQQPVQAEEPVPEPSQQAYDALIASFQEDGKTVYPSDYAGVWVEDDLLYIALTDNEEATLSRYNAVVGEYEVARYVKAQYPLSYLNRYQRVGQEAAASAHTIYSSYVDVQANVVVLEVAAEDIPAIWDTLHAQINAAPFFGSDIPQPRVDDIYVVRVGEPVVLD